MKKAQLAACAALFAMVAAWPATAKDGRKIVLIFVADGLRYDSVTPETAPTLYALKKAGVDFTNSHSLYPTVTTVNASAIATGHYIGDTGNFGNSLYTGFNSPEAGNAPVPFLEQDQILGEMNDHFDGNYLGEESLLAAARNAGYATAAMGKTGPAAIQDVTERDGQGTIVIDDSVGTPSGLPLTPEIAAAIKAAGLADTAPKSAVPNVEQQKYLGDIAASVVLPKLLASGKPVLMLFWSRDPDASQHAQKDSLGKLTPGINGPGGRVGIKDADDTLAGLIAALKNQGVYDQTDIFVTADHGFSTIEKHSATSAAARYLVAADPASAVDTRNALPPVQERDLPQGFVAIDLADALDLPLYDPSLHADVDYKHGHHPGFGNGFIGKDPAKPDVIVVANGGSEHIYIPSRDKALAAKLVAIMSKEDYVSGIFADDAVGPLAGTLPMSVINLKGSARTPQPSLIVNFRSHPIPGCTPLLMCAAEVADTSLATGQGMHGSFSRADTRNFMAASGPDFKKRYADRAPVSNADITPTLAGLLGLKIAPRGSLIGRVASEALPGGKPVKTRKSRKVSKPTETGYRTMLDYQAVGTTLYFDAAGTPGRTVGLLGH